MQRKNTRGTKRKRVTKKSEGVGDTIAKVTKATGIDKAVKFLAGEDCGCDERRKKLNELFPYRGTNCLTEKEYNYLTAFKSQKSNIITAQQQKELLKIYNRVFNARKKPSTCAPCVRALVDEIDKIYATYATTTTETK
jgi:hypothetical protein